MTPAKMQAEIERLAINWASLWFAAQKKNCPLPRYFYNEARSHIAWTVRINPNDKVNGEIVDLKSIYDAIDTSSLRKGKREATKAVFTADRAPTPPSPRRLSYCAVAAAVGGVAAGAAELFCCCAGAGWGFGSGLRGNSASRFAAL